MSTVYIDGRSFETDSSKNLLEVALSNGFDLPYFCWHPALGSVGACRQCAVKKFKDENDEQGMIVMSCMEPAADGTHISIKDPEAVEFRSSVIEWLMINHPHDCPTCDEGGECHLQDMTVMAGHNYRRHRFNKRTYRNQDLGPCINHEMNRCIQCYRCVRFYNEFAGGEDLQAMASKNHVYFGRYEDGTLESVFSGNLVEVCPTGVFTDKTLKKHYTRKWDFTNAPSICHHCSLGCNIIGSERYGQLRRIQSRYNGAVNGYFICDRGRFGYEHVNHEKRIRHAFIRNSSEQDPAPVRLTEGIEQVAKALSEGNGIIGIGSARASLEANHALQQLVGKENYHQGVPENEAALNKLALEVLENHSGQIPSMAEVTKADAILVLGEDLLNSAPMLGLNVRQATRNKGFRYAEKLQIPRWHDHAVREAVQDLKSPYYIVTPYKTDQDQLAEKNIRLNPDDIALLGYAIAGYIDNNAPQSNNLDEKLLDQAEEIARTLKEAKHPLVISGTSLGKENLLKASANIAIALGEKSLLSFVVKECNSMGSAIMNGPSIDEAFRKIESEQADTVIILENDLYRFYDHKTLERFFDKCKTLISLDYLVHPTVEQADIILPVGVFSETDGTLVNNEGRAQRYYQVHMPEGEIPESWRLLGRIMQSMNKEHSGASQDFEDHIDSLIRSYPEFEAIKEVAPPSGFKINGQKIPRSTHRFSGRTAIDADKHVNEPAPPEDTDSPLSFTMEGYHGKPPSSSVPYFWSPGWNSQQAINKYQIEVGGPLHDGDPGIKLIKEPGKGAYYKDLPKSSSPEKDQWLAIPRYYAFGSEQLSSHAPAIIARTPAPTIKINPEDAVDLNVREKEPVILTLDQTSITLPVSIDDSISRRTITVPVGFKELESLQLPARVKLKKG